MASVAGANKPAAAPGIVSTPAKSSFIAAFEYDQQNLTLTTHLKSGAIYQHKFVLPAEFVDLQTSKDQSKHWSTAIKGKKQSVRVKSQKAPNSEIKTGRSK